MIRLHNTGKEIAILPDCAGKIIACTLDEKQTPLSINEDFSPN